MSKERELLKGCLSLLNSLSLEELIPRIKLLNEIEELLAQPEQEQEVYAKGYAEAMRQQVYEAFEAGRKSALSNVTLRDHFAGLAVQALLTSKIGYIVGEDIAQGAYAMAGHMINERNKHMKKHDIGVDDE